MGYDGALKSMKKVIAQLKNPVLWVGIFVGGVLTYVVPAFDSVVGKVGAKINEIKG